MAKTSRLDHLVVQNSLLRSQIFEGLRPPEITEISSLSRVISLEKGETLFREGDTCDGFFVVQRGAISIYRVNAVGKAQIIHVFHLGESFAEAAIASGEGYPASARALSPSAVILIPKTEFVALLRKRPELALRMIGSMSRHLRNIVGLLDDLTLKNAEARCLNWLLRHCPTPRSSHPCEVELESPKRLVAAELNITSETLSRMLRRFREKQLIRTTQQGILVLDPLRTEWEMHQLLGEAVELVAR